MNLTCECIVTVVVPCWHVVYTQVEFIRAVWYLVHVAFCQNANAENGLGVDVQVGRGRVCTRVFREAGDG